MFPLALLLLSAQFLLVVFAFFLIVAFFAGAPYVPTPHKIIEEMLRLVPINKSDVVMDLGSGDGRVLFASVKKGARLATGWEINPILILHTKLLISLYHLSDQMQVYWGDYRHAKLNKATVIFVYALTNLMLEVEYKIAQEVKVGTTIISYKFPLPHSKPIRKTRSGIYIYRV